MSAEQSVRSYLTYLSDPTQLVDDEAVAAADRAVAEASDPIDRLKALGRRERAGRVDVDALEAAFVAEARSYAEAEGIPVQAFLEMGVDAGVLRRAGFDVPGSVARGMRSSSRTASSTSPRVTLETVRDVAIGFEEVFTVAQLEDATGASVGTVRRAIADLLEIGALRDVGPDPEHRGPGRAPTRYDAS